MGLSRTDPRAGAPAAPSPTVLSAADIGDLSRTSGIAIDSLRYVIVPQGEEPPIHVIVSESEARAVTAAEWRAALAGHLRRAVTLARQEAELKAERHAAYANDRGFAGTTADLFHGVELPDPAMWNAGLVDFDRALRRIESGDLELANGAYQNGLRQTAECLQRWRAYIGETIDAAQGSITVLKAVRDGAGLTAAGLAAVATAGAAAPLFAGAYGTGTFAALGAAASTTALAGGAGTSTMALLNAVDQGQSMLQGSRDTFSGVQLDDACRRGFTTGISAGLFASAAPLIAGTESAIGSAITAGGRDLMRRGAAFLVSHIVVDGALSATDSAVQQLGDEGAIDGTRFGTDILFGIAAGALFGGGGAAIRSTKNALKNAWKRIRFTAKLRRELAERYGPELAHLIEGASRCKTPEEFRSFYRDIDSGAQLFTAEQKEQLISAYMNRRPKFFANVVQHSPSALIERDGDVWTRIYVRGNFRSDPGAGATISFFLQPRESRIYVNAHPDHILDFCEALIAKAPTTMSFRFKIPTLLRPEIIMRRDIPVIYLNGPEEAKEMQRILAEIEHEHPLWVLEDRARFTAHVVDPTTGVPMSGIGFARAERGSSFSGDMENFFTEYREGIDAGMPVAEAWENAAINTGRNPRNPAFFAGDDDGWEGLVDSL